MKAIQFYFKIIGPLTPSPTYVLLFSTDHATYIPIYSDFMPFCTPLIGYLFNLKWYAKLRFRTTIYNEHVLLGIQIGPFTFKQTLGEQELT